MNLKSLYFLFKLTETETRLFEILLFSGPQKASGLAKQIKTNRTTVYNFLERLIDAGLIYESIKSGVKLFTVQPYEKILLLIKEQENQLQEARQTLEEFKKDLTKQNLAFQPKIQVFETQKELHQMMNDLLIYENITVRAYWPILKVIETLGKNFVEEFNAKRLKSNIFLRTIWPKNQIPDAKSYKFLTVDPSHKREVRIAPVNDFSLGYAIYHNTVRFISSSRENFGFLIESKDLAKTMKDQFDTIWAISKPFKKI